MLDHAWRQNRQPFQQGFRFRTTVRFDPPDDHVDPVISLLVRSLQHRVGFPHARRGAEKDLELAARLLGLFSLLRASARYRDRVVVLPSDVCDR